MNHVKWQNAVIPCALLCFTLTPMTNGSAVLSEGVTIDMINASDASAGDRFGRAVAVAGNVCVVGAPEDDDFGGDSGSAHVFRYDGTTWAHEAKLTATDGSGGDEFGSAVAVSKNLIVVGAHKHDGYGSNAGLAYVFSFDGEDWHETSHLVAPDATSSDQFGCSVAISGSSIVVGTMGDDDRGSWSGAVNVFQDQGAGWQHAQKLIASDGTAADFFGYSSAINNDVIVVGAFGDDRDDDNNGSAYVFRRGESGVWSQQQKLTAPVSANAFFGWSVAVTGNVVVVGAPEDSTLAANGGSLHAFRYDVNEAVWTTDGFIVPSDGIAQDRFATSVSIAENVIAAGAPRRDGAYPDSGAVYIFRHNGMSWSEDAVVTSASGYYWDEFGTACALSGNTLVAGAPLDDDGGNNAGTATAFRFESIVPCAADFDGSGMIDYADIFVLLDTWGPCEGACPTDLNGDGEVAQADLVLLIALWGPCG